MSLQKYVLQQSEKELNELEKKLQAELDAYVSTCAARVKEEERRYKTLVEDEVKRGVAREMFQRSKKSRFAESQSQSDALKALYVEVLEQLMGDASFVEKLVEGAFRRAEGTSLQAESFGKHGKLFAAAAEKLGKKADLMEGAQARPNAVAGQAELGGMRIVAHDRVLEIRLEDIVDQALRNSLHETFSLLFA